MGYENSFKFHLCVVAALIETHDLRGEADCDLSLLYNEQSQLAVGQWDAPKTVAPQCSFLRTRKGWVVTASGGVQVESWQVAAKSQIDGRVSQLRAAAEGKGSRWWWN